MGSFGDVFLPNSKLAYLFCSGLDLEKTTVWKTASILPMVILLDLIVNGLRIVVVWNNIK